MLKYETLPVTQFAQNASIVYCTETMDAAVIDPGGDLPELQQLAAQLGVTLKAIWLTHAHIDHAGGAGELAQKLGISVGGLNYCLNALIDKGFVKVSNFQQSKNKFKYVYLLTPQGFAEKVAMTSRFLKRKMYEYDSLKGEIEALKAEMGEDQGIGPKMKAMWNYLRRYRLRWILLT